MASGEKASAEMLPDSARGNPHDEQHHPPHHGMSAGKYIATRLTTLRPPMTKAPNPIRLLQSVTRTQWAFFAVAFFAWVSDLH